MSEYIYRVDKDINGVNVFLLKGELVRCEDCVHCADDYIDTGFWASRGIGWLVDDLGPCRRTAGYRNLQCWHGSSVYTTDEMSRLIDRIVEECKQQGIETLTPRELGEMKNAWKK